MVPQEIIIGLYISDLADMSMVKGSIDSISLDENHHFLCLIDPRADHEIFKDLNDDPQCTTRIMEKSGRAIAFNHLVVEKASTYCFLEAGVILSSGCLAALIDLLKAHENYGIISAATNNHWEAQSLYTDENPSSVDLSQRSEEISNWYKGEVLSLGPLYSMTEYFFLISLEAVAAVGLADEMYGTGYCWEMDLCLRVARSGFDCVWSKADYAHNGTISDPDRAESWGANKVHYQGKFCKSKLLKQSNTYCSHCLGERCADFAPQRLVQSFMHRKPHRQPLVSCLMPTRGRSQFVEKSIQYFYNQDYPNLELIILYDDAEDIPVNRQRDERIRYNQMEGSYTIGHKRNLGCKLARGEIIVQWDDDDIYTPDRISRQVAPILNGTCEVTGLWNNLFFDLEKFQFWECSHELFNEMFVEGVSGGTLTYHKRYWSITGGYPDRSLREDADFLVSMMNEGARLQRIDGRDCYAYLRHGNNSWKFSTGKFLDESGWSIVAPPASLASQLVNYKVMSPEPSPDPNFPAEKVSCIMPTANRRSFVAQAIRYFLTQDYPCKELIIVDDGEDKVQDLVPDGDPQIRYFSLDAYQTIGSKRNFAVSRSSGSVILHWDDDDWYSPEWIRLQVEFLKKTEAEVTGLDLPCFYEASTDQAWQYLYTERDRPWVHGATLCYTKSLWQKNPFPDLHVGEDSTFIWDGVAKNVIPHLYIDHYLGTIHEGNTSPKHTADRRWRSLNTSLLAPNR